MKLLNKLDKLNEDIEDINITISGLLNEQIPLIKPVLQWFLKRKLRKALTPGFNDDDDDFSHSWEKWEDSDKKESDIDDTISDIKDKIGLDKEKEEELRDMLLSIAEKQKKLIEDLIKDTPFESIRVKFINPIELKLKYGKNKGKELKLEGDKVFEVYSVDKKFGKTIINFNYETKKENWLKENHILFSITLKDPEPGKKYQGTTIKIIYVDDTALRSGTVVPTNEKVITHKSIIEIKSLK
tara:strand:+ start:8618 stop:9340 length:723 start_codon:yes stop_codon:yes gene_type:complete